ncbi:MAG: dephospho-CoA kinase [Candidatus Obscuribacter sp.]|nr:dephospho-CoA kinase [Candidatus Obscuribacter sp.]
MTTNKSGKPVYVIGLTGSIGSGKSAVGKMLEEMGVAVFDTDHMTHYLLNTPGPVYRQVIERFGADLVSGPEQPINRPKLGAIVFNDAKARADLEAIIHPAIAKLKNERIAQSEGLVAFLVPLLFETNSQCQYDEVWTVVVSPEVQMARLRVRDKRPDAEIAKRIAAQMPQDKKAAMSQVVIDNSADLDTTRNLVIAAHAGAVGRMRSKHGADAPVVVATPADAAVPAVDTTDTATAVPAVDATDTAAAVPAVDTTDTATAVPAVDTTDTAAAKPADSVAAAPADAAPAADAPVDASAPADNAPAPAPATAEEIAAREKHYKGVLRDFGHLATDEALNRIGDVALTSGKEARASMTMVVSAADGNATKPAAKAADNKPVTDGGADTATSGSATSPDGDAGKPAPTQERELRVEVLMSVRNRPGVDEPAPPTPPTNPPAPPAPPPAPEHKHGGFWRNHTALVIAFMAFLAFLVAMVVLYGWHKPDTITVTPPAVTVNPPAVNVTVGGPTVTVNSPPATTVVVEQAPVAVDPCPVDCGKTPVVVPKPVPTPEPVQPQIVPEYVPGATPCRIGNPQLGEAPAFAARFLHPDIRWAAARWTIAASCHGTVVEGFDKTGRIVVHQEFGSYLAFVGQTTYTYLPDGRVQVDRFDGNNNFIGRTYQYR